MSKPTKRDEEAKEASKRKAAQEKRQFEAVITAFTKKGEILLQDMFQQANSDVLGQNLYAVILEYVNNMKHLDKNYDPFPSDTFNLSTAKAVKKAVDAVELPKKKPAKRTDTANKDPRPAEEIIREELEASREKETVKQSKEEKKEDSSKKTDKKAQNKKAITTVNKTGKLLLAFIAERFIQEVLNINENATIPDMIAFEKYISRDDAELNKQFPSQITTTILHAVQTYKPVIGNLSSSKLNIAEERIDSILRENKIFTPDSKDDFDRSFLTKYTAQMLCGYFKVLGYILASYVWVSPKVISSKMIEYAIRVSDNFNPRSNQHGFYKGLFKEYYVLEKALYPPTEKKVSAKGDKKTKASKATEQDKVEKKPKSDKEPADKKVRTLAKPKAAPKKQAKPEKEEQGDDDEYEPETTVSDDDA